MDWFLQTKASRANTGVRESKSEHPHSNLQIEFGCWVAWIHNWADVSMGNRKLKMMFFSIYILCAVIHSITKLTFDGLEWTKLAKKRKTTRKQNRFIPTFLLNKSQQNDNISIENEFIWSLFYVRILSMLVIRNTFIINQQIDWSILLSWQQFDIFSISILTEKQRNSLHFIQIFDFFIFSLTPLKFESEFQSLTNECNWLSIDILMRKRCLFD